MNRFFAAIRFGKWNISGNDNQIVEEIQKESILYHKLRKRFRVWSKSSPTRVIKKVVSTWIDQKMVDLEQSKCYVIVTYSITPWLSWITPWLYWNQLCVNLNYKVCIFSMPVKYACHYACYIIHFEWNGFPHPTVTQTGNISSPSIIPASSLKRLGKNLLYNTTAKKQPIIDPSTISEKWCL